MGYEEMEQEQKDLFDKLFAQAYTAQQDMQTKDVRPKLEKGVDKFMKKADMICQNPNITNYLNQMIYTLDPDEMDPEDREDFLEEMGEMHVIYAARQGFADMLAKLVRYEPALANSSVPSSKLSALHWTAIKSASTVGDPGDNKYAGFVQGKTRCARVLLDAGAHIDIQDARGRTPISHAADEGNVDVCMLLMQRGANINLPDACGRTPLHWAASTGQEAIVKILKEGGADLRVKTKVSEAGQWEITAVETAAMMGQHHLLPLLCMTREGEVDTSLLDFLDTERWYSRVEQRNKALKELGISDFDLFLKKK